MGCRQSDRTSPFLLGVSCSTIVLLHHRHNHFGFFARVAQTHLLRLWSRSMTSTHPRTLSACFHVFACMLFLIRMTRVRGFVTTFPIFSTSLLCMAGTSTVWLPGPASLARSTMALTKEDLTSQRWKRAGSKRTSKLALLVAHTPIIYSSQRVTRPPSCTSFKMASVCQSVLTTDRGVAAMLEQTSAALA